MRIILGVTGCIAAYKSALIVRLLQEGGGEILPVMTRHAREFITPLTLEKLTGHSVVSDLFSDPTARIEHIALARQSDLLLVAPATANILGKFAHGIADDFLSTLYLSTVTPVVVAPAMNVEMWHHPATRQNIEILKGRNVLVVEPDSGYLACGEVGEGRLAEPEAIARAVLEKVPVSSSLAGKNVLITSGPTVEDIDPVRFLSNRSSGRMGHALAAAADRRGARVTLISGPTPLPPPQVAERVPVRSASDMAKAVFDRFPTADIVVMAAAVADFRPAQSRSSKIRKREGLETLRLTRNTDILKELGNRKRNQFLVGFAAESEDLLVSARGKLSEKNLDLIVANDISRSQGGFQSDSNQVVLIDPEGGEEASPLLPKNRIAEWLWERIEKRVMQPRPLEANKI
ncbi:MAG: bifunctional phosphopantothenoylcysteine decarboxylase/phosphopantothenate--cysteine ligase CoaBC [Acidobacteriota bacterium]